MKTRAMVLGVLLAACGTRGQIRVDSPVTPYQAPDISDITGIDEDDADSSSASDAGSAAATPAPAPTPTAAPAKPAGK